VPDEILKSSRKPVGVGPIVDRSDAHEVTELCRFFYAKLLYYLMQSPESPDIGQDRTLLSIPSQWRGDESNKFDQPTVAIVELVPGRRFPLCGQRPKSTIEARRQWWKLISDDTVHIGIWHDGSERSPFCNIELLHP
jgi:hypothetical protein